MSQATYGLLSDHTPTLDKHETNHFLSPSYRTFQQMIMKLWRSIKTVIVGGRPLVLTHKIPTS